MADLGDIAKRLVEARARANSALEGERFVEAAKILCDEFKSLLNTPSFWQGTHEAAQSAQAHRAAAMPLLNELPRLIDEEVKVFSGLEIDKSKWGPVVGDFFASYRPLQSGDDLSVDGLRMLEKNLQEATDLICKEKKGKLAYAYEWCVGKKGQRVLGHCALLAANATVVGMWPHVTWASMAPALRTAKEDAKDISALLKQLRLRK